MLHAEIDDIAKDLEFAKSRQGRFILFANDWAQLFHARLRADPRLEEVSVGSKPDQEVLAAYGHVASPQDLVRLVQLIAAEPPGVPIEYRIVVGP